MNNMKTCEQIVEEKIPPVARDIAQAWRSVFCCMSCDEGLMWAWPDSSRASRAWPECLSVLVLSFSFASTHPNPLLLAHFPHLIRPFLCRSLFPLSFSPHYSVTHHPCCSIHLNTLSFAHTRVLPHTQTHTHTGSPGLPRSYLCRN